jgi:bifunctional UDP-N-acetylglucosamine pyrophosphorylase/glucosamine-1-phosphate N-acetyltransferase
MKISTIILAAGKGKRMKSDLPKVLHPLLNRPMIDYVIDTARAIGSDPVVLVVGHKKELVVQATEKRKVEYVDQAEQLGTGHAVLQTAEIFKNYDGHILVLSGDVPLLTTDTLKRLIDTHDRMKPLASLLTAYMPDPTGYGRVVRDERGYVKQIVEHKDADEKTLQIKEINVGIYIFQGQALFETLPEITNENSQGEYYLPDVIKMYVERGEKVAALMTRDEQETHGINDVGQLEQAEKILAAR